AWFPFDRAVPGRPDLPRRRPGRPGHPAITAADLHPGALRRNGADPAQRAYAGLVSHLAPATWTMSAEGATHWYAPNAGRVHAQSKVDGCCRDARYWRPRRRGVRGGSACVGWCPGVGRLAYCQDGAGTQLSPFYRGYRG